MMKFFGVAVVVGLVAAGLAALAKREGVTLDDYLEKAKSKTN